MNAERRHRLLLSDTESRIAADELAFYETHCTLERVAQRPSDVSDIALWLDAQGLALLAPGFATPFRLSEADLVARRRVATELTRACGALGPGDTIADPFAGFAIDALTLAGTGAVVTAMEREPLVFLLMRDFVHRCQGRVTPTLGDGLALLGGDTTFDVVYLDPMFEPRRKRALPNRGLQHLRELARGDDTDVQALLDRAKTSARRRVVLKRRPKDPTADKPSHTITGKAVRFDVYT